MTPPGDVDALTHELRRIAGQLERMMVALMGDRELGTVGIAGRVERVEAIGVQHDIDRKQSSEQLHKRIDQIERRIDRIQWTIAGWAAGGVVGGGGLVVVLARLGLAGP